MAAQLATTRPATFDAAVMEYLPGLRNLAHRLGWRDDDKAEIVNDTIVDVLNRWKTYKEEYGLWSFLQFAMRSLSVTRRRRANRNVSVIEFREEYSAAVAPTQQDFAELSSVLRRLSGTRDSDALMRVAMGDELGDVANDMGITKQRVFQLCQRERARLAC